MTAPTPIHAGASPLSPERRPQRPARKVDDFIMPFVKPRPLVVAGIYEAVSTAVKLKRMRARRYVEIVFTVFEGAFSDGVVLATDVPAFFNVPEGGIGPGSRLARLYQLLDPHMKPGALRASVFEGKAWKVKVVTVSSDTKETALPEANRYSKIDEVLERLA